jgi:hypothetical protein
MPKNSRRKEAALRRERDKRGEKDPKEAATLAQDGNYIPEDTSVNDAPPANSDTDLTPSQLGERIRNLARAAVALLPGKVIRNGDTDLMPNMEVSDTQGCVCKTTLEFRPTRHHGRNAQRTMISSTALPPDRVHQHCSENRTAKPKRHAQRKCSPVSCLSLLRFPFFSLQHHWN